MIFSAVSVYISAADMMVVCRNKSRRQAARGLQGATNLTVNQLAASHLQLAQKNADLAPSATAKPADVDMSS
jgi:hypothetical protein